jgi:hypothetical protein
MQTVISEDKPAGTVSIHCPVCHRQGVEGRIIEMRETLMENLVIPVSTHTTWWVVCSGCETRLYSELPAQELVKRTPDQLVGVIRPRVSLIRKFLAITALGLALAPGLGLVMGLIGWAANRKSIGWPKTVSRVGLGVSVLFHLFMVGYVIVGVASMPRRPH